MAIPRYLETDGVPAPSDFELMAYDKPETCTISYRTFYHTIAPQVAGDREKFHAFVRGEGGQQGPLTEDQWWWWWAQYLKQADAKDEANTQNDALL